MATGRGVIMRVQSSGNYAYTWVDDTGQLDVDNVVTGKTLSQAYNEIGALALAMGGTVRNAEIVVTSS